MRSIPNNFNPVEVVAPEVERVKFPANRSEAEKKVYERVSVSEGRGAEGWEEGRTPSWRFETNRLLIRPGNISSRTVLI